MPEKDLLNIAYVKQKENEIFEDKGLERCFKPQPHTIYMGAVAGTIEQSRQCIYVDPLSECTYDDINMSYNKPSECNGHTTHLRLTRP